MAAGIAVFVAPVNIAVACQYAPTTGEGEKLARGVVSSPVLPKQLFALVSMLYKEEGRSSARILFEKKCGIELAKVMNNPVGDGGKK